MVKEPSSCAALLSHRFWGLQCHFTVISQGYSADKWHSWECSPGVPSPSPLLHPSRLQRSNFLQQKAVGNARFACVSPREWNARSAVFIFLSWSPEFLLFKELSLWRCLLQTQNVLLVELGKFLTSYWRL